MTQMNLQQAIELGIQHHRAGRFSEAQNLYQHVLSQQPSHPDGLHLLGLLNAHQGRHDAAIELIGRAIAVNPSAALFHCSLGQVLAGVGRLNQSVLAYQKALTLDPEIPDAWNEMGLVLNKLGRRDESIDAIGRAIRYRPADAAFHASLGHVLYMKGDLEPAIKAFEEALRLSPDYVEAHHDLGTALMEFGRLEQAMAHYQRAIELRPEYLDARRNLGSAYVHAGRLVEAEAAFREAIARRPDDALAHVNLGLVLLLQGRFEEGWTENEWRWRVPELGLQPIQCAQPLWDGRDLNGRRILLWADQGLGDAIQMARFVSQVKKRRGTVLLRVPTELKRLMQDLAGVDQLLVRDEPLPSFDVHCPLFTLPLVLGTTLQNIPPDVPYLRVDEPLVLQWRQRLAKEARLKVGLSWAGRKGHKNDFNRSVSLAALAPLAGADVCIVSLQKGDGVDQARKPPDRMTLVDWTDDLKDLADTAALIENLDLVITVDTAVAHLAGAMGKATWVLLPSNPDWRWLLSREDSPWYPTMRLFRQPTFGDWASPIQQVAKALGKYRAAT